MTVSDWEHYVTFSWTLKQHFTYTSNTVLHACWSVPSYHTFPVPAKTTSYFKLLYQIGDCRSCWSKSHAEFCLKLSLHCYKTTGLVKCFDSKHVLLHDVCHPAQFTFLTLLTFPHPVVSPFTFPTSHSNCCRFFWIPCSILGELFQYHLVHSNVCDEHKWMVYPLLCLVTLSMWFLPQNSKLLAWTALQ
jgi:hypothetical protein